MNIKKIKFVVITITGFFWVMLHSSLAQAEQVLNDLARQIIICTKAPDSVSPGDIIDIELSLPPDLNGTGSCKPNWRVFKTTVPRSTAQPEVLRSDERRPRRPIRSGMLTGPSSGSIPTLGPTNITEIPCQLLPGGCPPQVNGLTITGINVQWSVNSNGNTKSPGTDYSDTPDKLTNKIVVAPLKFTDLTPTNPSSSLISIVATVTVTAKNLDSTSVSSSPIPIKLPLSLADLQVPKVFVLFKGKNYSEAAAIYLPQLSALNENTLRAAVENVHGKYDAVQSNLSFVPWFAEYVTGLSELKKVFSLSHWDVKELKDREWNLNNDDFIHRSRYTSLNDAEVEDESDALILFGVEGTSATFFQHRDFKGNSFTATTQKNLVVIVPDLGVIHTQPPGIVNSGWTENKTPVNSLSSFKWVTP